MTTTILSPIATRFAWKEYRTLRGLWLAVLALGALVQWVSMVLAAPGSELPMIMLAIALGATILYAIGASSILYSVEHEEETHQFLSGLPANWFPMLIAKYATATLSAVLLATLLALAGWTIAGREGLSVSEANELIAALGVGILEALAWGTLFSLLVKRPLVAAMLTIVVGTIAVQYVVSTKAAGNLISAKDPRAYAEAVPLRLAIVFGLLVLSGALAKRWLMIGSRPLRFVDAVAAPRLAPLTDRIAAALGRVDITVSRRRLLARLVWQTWRQSWKSLLVPAAVALFLTIGISAVNSFALKYTDLLIAATAFFLPALYGAMVFGGDQRRRQYRFLADHAASPRYVWLARQIVWGGTFFALAAVLSAIAFWVSTAAFYDHVRRFANQETFGYTTTEDLARLLELRAGYALVAADVAVCGTLLAYAVGQLFSMLLRSEIMAAFAACVASVFVTAWCALMLGWGLSGMFFVLPLAIGFLLATWLRAPDWITERNSWRAWFRPLVAIVLAAAAVAALVPVARLAQVPAQAVRDAETIIVPVRKAYEVGDTPAARETAAMYFKAADLLDSWQEHDPLARWVKTEYISGLGEIDIQKIPPDELDDYRRALKKQRELQEAAHAAALDEFIAASKRETCRFQFDLRYAPIENSYPTVEELERFRARLDPQYLRLIRLTTRLANAGVPNDKAVDWYLAGLRATAHLRNGQPTLVFIDQLSMEKGVLNRIVEWATYSHPTDSEIRDAIKRLQTHFASLPDPAEAIWADYKLVRDVLVNDELPLVFAHPPITSSVHLAYLLHQLPWERERALRQLEVKTAADIHRVRGLGRILREGPRTLQVTSFDWPNNLDTLRRSLEAAMYGRDEESVPGRLISALLTFGVLEYGARVQARELELYFVDTEMHRRATMLQLALELYRRDHDRYPETLAELAPEYLDVVPLDPYSGRPFYYLPSGTDLPVVDALASGKNIEPGTPFFWSVGPSNFTKLVRIAGWDEERDPIDPDIVTGYSQQKAAYRFWRDDWSWHWGTVLGVFPLPK